MRLNLTLMFLEVGSEKMCVKWQHFAEQKRTVGLSVIVNMSAINIKMSKSKRESSSMIGTKKDSNNTETCYYIFSFLGLHEGTL